MLRPWVRLPGGEGAPGPAGSGLGLVIAHDLAQREGGRLLLEIGASQRAAVETLLAAAGLTRIATFADLDGRDRVVTAERAS